MVCDQSDSAHETPVRMGYLFVDICGSIGHHDILFPKCVPQGKDMQDRSDEYAPDRSAAHLEHHKLWGCQHLPVYEFLMEIICSCVRQIYLCKNLDIIERMLESKNRSR